MEINEIRPFFKHAMGVFTQLSRVQEDKEVNEP